VVESFSTTTPSLRENIFGVWQPRYAERGLATFPVRIAGHDKIPMNRGYHRTGLRGSAELTKKFGDALALGITLNQRRMIVDLDTNNESALADVLARYGDTPLIALTASKGGFHCYYGENTGAWRHYKQSRRAIRPEVGKPVDYLGAGFAVLPPSVTATGRYEFIRGGLDDLQRLPPFGGVVPPPLQRDAKGDTARQGLEPRQNISEGGRNNALFLACMSRAHTCSHFDALLAFARDINASYRPPLDDAEVVKTVSSAWRYEQTGKNHCWQHVVQFAVEDVIALLNDNQDAFLLLAFLHAHNGRRAQFMIANGLTEVLGWSIERLRAARKRLIELRYIEQIRKASDRKAALYQWSSIVARLT
jgi:Bifunctional DNA primase/polymerase, N-terminal/Primase C terminal 1 (PriCT-1)